MGKYAQANLLSKEVHIPSKSYQKIGCTKNCHKLGSISSLAPTRAFFGSIRAYQCAVMASGTIDIDPNGYYSLCGGTLYDGGQPLSVKW